MVGDGRFSCIDLYVNVKTVLLHVDIVVNTHLTSPRDFPTCQCIWSNDPQVSRLRWGKMFSVELLTFLNERGPRQVRLDAI